MNGLADSQSDVEFVWLDSRPLPADVEPAGWSVAVDAQGAASAAMEVPGFPFLYVIDARGHVAAKGIVNSVDEIRTLVRRGLRKGSQGAQRVVAKT